MFNVNRTHPGAFKRIGDRYNKFINPYHFLGRNALEDSWVAGSPLTNVSKNEDTYLIELALPGFAKEDIQVNLEGDHLIVECQKDHGAPDKWPKAIRREYSYDQVREGFILPANAQKDAITSNYQNGVLSISIPYTTDSPKTIEVGS